MAELTCASGRRTVLWVVCLASFMNPFMSSALNLAAPAMGAELGASAVQLSWILTTFLLSTAAFLVPCGRLGDLLGRARIFKVGMVTFAALTALAGLVDSVASMVVVRLVQGVAASMAFATAMPLVIDAFPARERGRVLGISTAAVYVGLSCGPPLGGLVAQHLGWRAIFLICGGVSLAAAAVAFSTLDDDGPRGGGRFDAVSAALYVLALTTLLMGVSTTRSHAAAPWLLAGGALAAGLFVWRERAARVPVLKLELFRSPVFALSNVAALINYSATFAVTFLLSVYLQTVRGLAPRTAGLLLLVQPVLMAVLSPLAGRLSDRFEPRIVASMGMALTSLGLAVAATLDRGTHLGVLVAALVLLGLGFGLFSSPNTNAVMSAVERSDYGVASATLSTMRVVGQASSMAFVAMVTAVHLGRAPLTPEAAPHLLLAQRTAFMVFAGLCALGIAASLARGRMHS